MKTHFGSHVPDILDCLAQLSNSAVPTPPKLAKAMLDILPDEVWSRPDYVWLDPFSKSGVFLREVATRLFDGLADWEPDFVARREHIFRNMLFGAATTEMTGIVSRRSVYCSADASSAHSVVRFEEPQGDLSTLNWEVEVVPLEELMNMPTGASEGDLIESFAKDPQRWVAVRNAGDHRGVREMWDVHGTWKRWPILIDRTLVTPGDEGLQVIEGRTRVGVLRGRARLGLNVAPHHLAWVARTP